MKNILQFFYLDLQMMFNFRVVFIQTESHLLLCVAPN